jgi:hypothetical protein
MMTSAIIATIPWDSKDWHEPFGYRHHDRFHVLLTNVSPKPVRLWQEWCSWGYYSLEVELVEENGTRHLLKKKPTSFYTNFPDDVLLEPGGSSVWDVDLQRSDVWQDLSWFPKDKRVDGKLRVIFSVPEPNTELDRVIGASEVGVWTGQVISECYDFSLFGPNPTESK